MRSPDERLYQTEQTGDRIGSPLQVHNGFYTDLTPKTAAFFRYLK